MYILIDLHSVLIRYAAGALNRLNTIEQKYGGLLSFLELVQHMHVHYGATIVIFSDRCKNNFRYQIDAKYKNNRRLKPLHEYITFQLSVVDNYIKQANITHIYHDRYESDDLIASFIECYPDDKHLVVSSDKDMFQLLNHRVKIYNPFQNQFKRNIIDEKCVQENIQVHPKDFALYQALMGDASDCVKGVPNIGPVTAKKIIAATNCIHTIKQNYNYDFSNLNNDLQLTTLNKTIDLTKHIILQTDITNIQNSIHTLLSQQ